MTKKYSDLKKAAEAAPEGPWFGPEYAPGTSYVFDVDLGTLLHYESIDTEKDECLRYVALANPSTVLALLADLAAHEEEAERLRAENTSLRGSTKRMVEDISRMQKQLRKSTREIEKLTKEAAQ